MPAKELLDTAQVAKWLNIAESTVRKRFITDLYRMSRSVDACGSEMRILKSGYRREPRQGEQHWLSKSSGNKTCWTRLDELGYSARRKEVVSGLSNGVLSEAIPRGAKMGVFRKGKDWWIDFYHQGKRIRRKVGPSKKVAEMALADVQVKKARHEFLGVSEPKKILFRDFAKEYLEYSKANKAKRSYERDILTIEGHVLGIWGNEHLARLTPKMIEDYKVQRLQYVVAATVNREIDTIKNMLRKAVEWGYLPNSPGASVKKLRTGAPHFRYLSGDESRKLLAACRGSDNRQLYPFVVVALTTGMRLGELTALEWKDVDFKRGILRVDNKLDHHTKNYQVRTIPMNEFVTEVLRKIPRRLDSSYVFQRKDGEKFHKMRTGFENAVKRSGIPHVRFHDLRHTFASHLVMGGVDIRTVQELLGHKDIRMTMRYSHLAPDHMRKAVSVLDYESQETETLSEAHS